MEHAQKKILEDLVAEARAEMQPGAAWDRWRACNIGRKIQVAAVWESMDPAEKQYFQFAVLDFAEWLKPLSLELSDSMIWNMTMRCFGNEKQMIEDSATISDRLH